MVLGYDSPRKLKCDTTTFLCIAELGQHWCLKIYEHLKKLMKHRSCRNVAILCPFQHTLELRSLLGREASSCQHSTLQPERKGKAFWKVDPNKAPRSRLASRWAPLGQPACRLSLLRVKKIQMTLLLADESYISGTGQEEGGRVGGQEQ